MVENTAPVNPAIFDPYLKIRERTAQRNDILNIADRYAKMSRLALMQANDLRQRKGTKAETLEMLTAIIKFCDLKAEPLFEKVTQLDSQNSHDMEVLQNE